MLRRVFAAVAALLVFVVPQAAAQDQAAACAAVLESEVGYWAAFNLEGEAAADVSSLRFALIEREGESNPNWYEFHAETNQGPVTIQMDVPSWPFEPADVAGMILKAPGQPAMRMPKEMIAMMQAQMGDNPMVDVAERCAEAEGIGSETIEVPAGSFSTFHIRDDTEQADVWISPDVPFGVVKISMPDGGMMQLTGFGTDATSGITEEPQTMPGMGGMN
jgi:hypothetical protein